MKACSRYHHVRTHDLGRDLVDYVRGQPWPPHQGIKLGGGVHHATTGGDPAQIYNAWINVSPGLSARLAGILIAVPGSATRGRGSAPVGLVVNEGLYTHITKARSPSKMCLCPETLAPDAR
jgi:hypothetical protein